MITRIKGNQIFDGTITSANIDDTLEKEFTKVRITTDDSTPNFLYSKIDTSGSIFVNVVGSVGTSQTLAITGSGAPFAGGLGADNNLITTDGNGNLVAESKFNFDGSILNLTGSAKITGSYLHVSSGSLDFVPEDSGWEGSLLRIQKYIDTSAYNNSESVAAKLSLKSDISSGLITGTKFQLISSQSANGSVAAYGNSSLAIHNSSFNNTSFLAGNSGVAVLSSSSGETLGNLAIAYGSIGTVGFYGNVAAGSITDASALYALKTGVGASTTITTARGLQVTNMGGTGVTNAIGIDVASQAGASTINLGLRTQSPIVVGTTNVAGTEKLRVNGTSYFDDAATFVMGLSGSLTNLADGSSYLVAGTGISITSASNGAITITGNVGDITSVTAGTGLTGGGTSGDVTLAINNSVVATISGSRFTGNVGIKNTNVPTLASLHISGSSAATLAGAGYPTLEVEGAWLRIGDKTVPRTFSDGLGIKLFDQSLVHYSVGQNGGIFTIAQTSSDGDALFTADRVNLLVGNNAGNIAFGLASPSATAKVYVTGSSTANVDTLVLRHGRVDGSALGVLRVQNSAGSDLFYVSGSGGVGIATITPRRSLHVGLVANNAGIAIGTSTDYIETISTGAGFYRIQGVGTITNLEQFIDVTIPQGKKFGFSPTNNQPADVGFTRVATGILSISGSAPGAVLRFNATSAPLAAGDLGMNTSTGRPTAYIGGAIRSLAHIDELPPSYFFSTTAGSIFTTGSAAFVGNQFVDSPADIGTDAFFYVSGSMGSKGTTTRGTAVFGGDVVISGTLHGGSPLKIDGGLVMTNGTMVLTTENSKIEANQISGSLTRLVDGTSYLIAGSNIAISTGSLGNITIETVAPGSSTQLLFNSNGAISASANLSFVLNPIAANNSTLALTGTLGMSGNVMPEDDVTYNLGSPEKRWANIYTGDLHLKNERGDWTIIEEETFLSIRNNKTGKRFKINMEAVPELDDK